MLRTVRTNVLMDHVRQNKMCTIGGNFKKDHIICHYFILLPWCLLIDSDNLHLSGYTETLSIMDSSQYFLLSSQFQLGMTSGDRQIALDIIFFRF